jgi:hypothetical protein
MNHGLCHFGLCHQCASDQASVRAFYGPAYDILLAAERKAREDERIRAMRRHELIDEYAAQVAITPSR